jgi:hypothetical protein
MAKDLTVVVAGTGEIKDIAIESGTTADDVLRSIGLQGYALSKDGSSSTFFQRKENIYPLVEDGTKLWASTDPKVGQGEGFGPPASPRKNHYVQG